MKDKENRFQFQPWHVKLWRRRHQLLIPYEALKIYMGSYKRKFRDTWRIAWRIAIGEADIKMEWWWSSEEVIKQLKKI